MERMHPEDRRAMLAGSIANGIVARGGSFDIPGIVEMADMLQADLERTADPVVMDYKDRDLVVGLRTRAESAEQELAKAKHLLRDLLAFNESHTIEEAEVRASIKPMMALFGVTDWGSNAFALKGIGGRVMGILTRAELAEAEAAKWQEVAAHQSASCLMSDLQEALDQRKLALAEDARSLAPGFTDPDLLVGGGALAVVHVAAGIGRGVAHLGRGYRADQPRNGRTYINTSLFIIWVKRGGLYAIVGHIGKSPS